MRQRTHTQLANDIVAVLKYVDKNHNMCRDSPASKNSRWRPLGKRRDHLTFNSQHIYFRVHLSAVSHAINKTQE